MRIWDPTPIVWGKKDGVIEERYVMGNDASESSVSLMVKTVISSGRGDDERRSCPNKDDLRKKKEKKKKILMFWSVMILSNNSDNLVGKGQLSDFVLSVMNTEDGFLQWWRGFLCSR